MKTTAKINCDSTLYCGETINISVQGDNIDLLNTPFVVYLYGSNKEPRIFQKTEGIYQDGVYIFTIPAEDSALMAPGNYTLEIFIRGDEVCIDRLYNFMTLKDCLIKEEA